VLALHFPSYEVEKRLSKGVGLLWSQDVDDNLYTDSHQGDEDQRTGHRLVARVQVAADSEEYGAKGEQKYANEHAPQYHTSEETGREQHTRSHAQSRLHPPRGVSLFELSHTTYLPGSDSPATIPPQTPPF
jgi:hypothetical protein